jgi:hypothetical protein
MADTQTQYDVVVNLRLKKIEQAQAGVQKVAKEMERLQSKVALNTQGLSNMVGRIVAIGAVYMGVRAISNTFLGAAKSALAFNADLETTRIGLASVIGAVQGISFQDAMAPAQKIFEDLRDDAIKSTATTKELFDIFQAIVGPISAAGYGLQDVRELTNSTVAAASALNVDFAQAQRDIGMMVRGTAGMDVKLFSMLRSTGAIAEDAEKWNKSLSGQQRVEKLKAALAKFAPAAEAYGKSWKGVTSSFKDITDQLMGAGAGPIFEAIKKYLDGINQKLLQNREYLTQTFQRWGETLAKTLGAVFAKLESGMRFATENWDKINKTFHASVGIMQKAAIAIGAAKAMSAVGGVLDLGALGAGGMGGAAAALLPLAGILALVAGAVSVAIDHWKELTSVFGNVSYLVSQLIGPVIQLGQNLWGILGPSLRVLATLAGSMVWATLNATIQGLILLIQGLNFWLAGLRVMFDGMITVINRVTDAIISFVERVSSVVAQVFGKSTSSGTRGLKNISGYDQRIMSMDTGILNQSLGPAGNGQSLDMKGKPMTKTVNDFRGSRITVKQDFRQADPDRIAIQMIEDINRQAEARTQSGFVSAFAR